MSNAISAIRAFHLQNPDVIDRLQRAYGDDVTMINGVVMAELLSVILETTVTVTDWNNWQNVKDKSIVKNRIHVNADNRRREPKTEKPPRKQTKPRYMLSLARAAEIMDLSNEAVSRALRNGSMRGEKKKVNISGVNRMSWFTSAAAIKEYQTLPGTKRGIVTKDFITVANAARMLGLPELEVRGLISEGDLEAHRNGKHGRWRIKPDSVLKMKKKLP